MAIQKQTRQIGDTLIALGATLQRPDGTAVSVANLTTKFTMVDSEGDVKVAETTSNVSETDAAAGEVQYTFQTADVDTEGTYNAYFITEDGSGNQDTFPAQKGDLQVEILATA